MSLTILAVVDTLSRTATVVNRPGYCAFTSEAQKRYLEQRGWSLLQEGRDDAATQADATVVLGNTATAMMKTKWTMGARTDPVRSESMADQIRQILEDTTTFTI